jgi:CRP-like cAMP-binding protein
MYRHYEDTYPFLSVSSQKQYEFIKFLTENTEVKIFPADEFVYYKGKKISKLYMIEDGLVEFILT